MHNRLQHSGTAFSAALLIAALAAPPAAPAQNTSLSPDSDGGGSTFTALSCGANRVLMAVNGRAGGWVDRVQGVCVQITSDGRWIGGETTTSSSPGTSGTAFSLRCPPNHAVSGLSGRAGNFIDRLSVRCKPLTTGGRLSGSAVLARTASGATFVGGSGGTSFGPTDCTSTVPARAINGQSGALPLGPSFVDQIGLNCAMPTPFRISGVALSPTSVAVPNSAAGTISFNRGAPAPFSVSLTTNNSTIASPTQSSVPVGIGATNASFSVRTSQAGCATIAASHAGSSSSRGLIVQPSSSISMISLSTPLTLIVESGAQTAKVTGSRAGAVVALSSSAPNIVSVPANVTLRLTGTRTAEGQFSIRGLGFGCATITATYGSSTVRRTVQAFSIGG